MSKIVRMFVVIIAVMVQVLLGLLYGFSGVAVPAWGCLVIWCVCAVTIECMMGLSKEN